MKACAVEVVPVISGHARSSDRGAPHTPPVRRHAGAVSGVITVRQEQP